MTCNDKGTSKIHLGLLWNWKVQTNLTLVLSKVSLCRVFYNQYQNPTTKLTVGLILALVGQQPALLKPPWTHRQRLMLKVTIQRRKESTVTHKIGVPYFGYRGTLYNASELCIFIRNEYGILHFVYKTRRYCRNHTETHYSWITVNVFLLNSKVSLVDLV